jgi:hypothetical protein
LTRRAILAYYAPQVANIFSLKQSLQPISQTVSCKGVHDSSDTMNKEMSSQAEKKTHVSQEGLRTFELIKRLSNEFNIINSVHGVCNHFTHTCTLTGVVCIRVCWRVQVTETWNVLPYSFWRKVPAASEISQRLHERAKKEIYKSIL